MELAVLSTAQIALLTSQGWVVGILPGLLGLDTHMSLIIIVATKHILRSHTVTGLFIIVHSPG